MNIKIKVPSNAKLLIKTGQNVDFSTPFIQKNESKFLHIPLANNMGFKAKDIFRYIKKAIGEKISKGDLLAENKSFLSTKRYLSDTEGVIEGIDHEEGALIIKLVPKDASDILCYFKGEVDGIYDGYFELKVDKAHATQIVDSLPTIGAPVFYLSSSLNDLTEDDISSAIIFTSTMEPIQSTRMKTLGAAGVILKSIHPDVTDLIQIVLTKDNDYSHVQKEKFPYMIVGHEPQTVYFYH